MSLLTTGLVAPDVLQFATEPVTITGEPGIEFKNASGTVVGTMAYDGTNVDLALVSGTNFEIQRPNSQTMVQVQSTSGNMYLPRFNGLVTSASGISVSPPAVSYDVSPAQMATFAGVFGKGIWIISGSANTLRPPAYPGNAFGITITKDPTGTPTTVGTVNSFVGSDTSDSVGNYFLSPFCYAIPMTQSVDTSKTYRVAVTNGYVSTVQYVPLY